MAKYVQQLFYLVVAHAWDFRVKSSQVSKAQIYADKDFFTAYKRFIKTT